ncbi:sucrase/ferredoxin-like domain-containing protein ASCRUDRAFT_77847 [Ascoidea rubescens DSM 1968]|uniref:Altered inheritance of mitochondria protein 32 n=1 Tax=Ascoidea rubescens DSM 1968 TaxID=1344418 RepID=A0A1D2VAY2_9ASCO|nr:hypothetical protein ASCRUDRAFT_77847 [Ascoidea rubescens DSM 1968]ODV58613.1 hypothetical protein ASCRUDRAFT_77847 [Ascoidea rubescens DSM 1968]
MIKNGINQVIRFNMNNYSRNINRKICNCEILKQLPKDKQINYEKSLKGTKVNYYKHLLIFSNKSGKDWPSRLEMDPESIISSFNLFKRKIISNLHPVLISEISLIDYHQNESTSDIDKFKAILYPNNLIFPRLMKNNDNIQEFMKNYLRPDNFNEIENKISSENNNFFAFEKKKLITKSKNNVNCNREKVKNISKEKPQKEINLEHYKNKNGMILICGHLKRDIRCGLYGPILLDEFAKELESRKLLFDEKNNPKGIKIGLISHVGGHAVSRKIMIQLAPNQKADNKYY